MKTYNIWSEGYLCTGMEGRPADATYHGSHPGKTFKDACIKFFSIKENDDRGDFDAERLTFWGCHLYDNEVDARQTFG